MRRFNLEGPSSVTKLTSSVFVSHKNVLWLTKTFEVQTSLFHLLPCSTTSLFGLTSKHEPLPHLCNEVWRCENSWLDGCVCRLWRNVQWGMLYNLIRISLFTAHELRCSCFYVCVDMYVCVCTPVSRMRVCVHACVILYSTGSQNLAILCSFQHVQW